jgi:hypothetical protein
VNRPLGVVVILSAMPPELGSWWRGSRYRPPEDVSDESWLYERKEEGREMVT